MAQACINPGYAPPRGELLRSRRGLGAALLMNATDRTLQAAAAAFALLVDAKNDQAVGFYRHYGFLTLVSRPRTLFLPLKTAQKVFHQ